MAQISNKVVAGTGAGGLVGIATALLVTFIPAWHSGIPPTLQPLIAVLLTTAFTAAGGYLARHYPTAAEVEKYLQEAERTVRPATSVTLAPPSYTPTVRPGDPLGPQ